MTASVQKATGRFLGTRAAVVEILGNERWEELRQAGYDLRLHAITHLDYYLAQLEERVTQAGGHVHWAQDAAEARRIVLEIARQHQVRRAVKSKSMATEEIGLNHALEDAGVQVLETDLGEYIIQLAGVGPSHIIVPAVHLTKEGIAELFHAKLDVEAPPDPKKLTEIARATLREEFLAADMGISGGNFLVAETGTLVVVTNEGNGRMCTTLPPVHVAVVGIDKVVSDWDSLAVMLKLLARSATGQKLSTYTSFITGPRRTEGENGPQEFHLVLLDNGRTRILQDEITRETLLCIRCGACLNVCPVYNNVGGHAYGWVYSGPVGAILSPQLLGTSVAADLPFASSLCGACSEICPVKVPIPEILLHLRHRAVEGDQIEEPVASPVLRAGAQISTLALGTPWLYTLGARLLKVIQSPLRRNGWLFTLPPPVDRWTMVRPFPAFRADFRGWWRKRPPTADRRPPPSRKLGSFWEGAGLAVLAVSVSTALAVWLTRRWRK
jgi:L-lactate dehydrogenase complex protein LldF